MSRSNEWILVGKATVWLHFDGHVVDCKGHTQFREKILKEILKKYIPYLNIEIIPNQNKYFKYYTPHYKHFLWNKNTYLFNIMAFLTPFILLVGFSERYNTVHLFYSNFITLSRLFMIVFVVVSSSWYCHCYLFIYLFLPFYLANAKCRPGGFF